MGGLWLNKTKLIQISTQVEAVFEVWLEIVLKINFHGWGWVAGSIETKTISAFNLKLKLKLTEADLGNILLSPLLFSWNFLEKFLKTPLKYLSNTLKTSLNHPCDNL